MQSREAGTREAGAASRTFGTEPSRTARIPWEMTISFGPVRNKTRGAHECAPRAGESASASGCSSLCMGQIPIKFLDRGIARGWPRRAAAALVSLTLAAGASGLGAQKQGRGKKKPSPTLAAVPFAAGERLQFAAQWNKFVTAATLKVNVVERRDFFGKPAWHFQALASTIDPVRMLYTIDDQFDSYMDATTLESRQYEAYLREQSKHEDTIVPMATKPDSSRGNLHVYLVLAGTEDPVGILYGLRAHDWTREPVTRIPVFDGRKYYEVDAKRESAGMPLTVAAGSFVVTRIALRAFTGGQEVTDLKVWLSLAQDAARTPVLIEAEAPFGTVRAELTSRAP